MRILFLFLAFIGGLCGQNNVTGPSTCVQYGNCYVAYRSASLSTTAAAVTVQAGTTLNVYFDSFTISCSVACTVTVAQNGVAATTTAFTPSPLNSAPAATSTAYSSSNVGSGTTIETIPLAAGGYLNYDLSKLTAQSSANGSQNLTVSTNAVSGTVIIKILYVERNT